MCIRDRHYPVDRFYWVQANTTGIPNAPDETRWTFWGACTRSNGETLCSGDLAPAYPISPRDNFNTEVNVPHHFLSNRDAFYYLTRFSFAFFWIALAFVGVSFILYLLSWISSTVLQVIFILMIFGFIFNVVAVVLQTAATVMARNAFHDGDRSADIGAALMGIAWASVAVCIIEMAFIGFSFIANKYEKGFKTPPHLEPHTNAKFGFFHRKRGAIPQDTIRTPIPTTQTEEPNNVVVPNTGTLGSPEIPHKGIKFFKIKRTHTPGDDDSI